MFANGVADGESTVRKLLLDLSSGLKNKQWVSESVISDHVARADDFANDIGALPYVSANQKECGADIVICQHVEKTKCVRIVWAVIIGERQPLRAGANSRERSSVPLPGGRHGLVSCCSSDADSSSGTQRAEHHGIVNACLT